MGHIEVSLSALRHNYASVRAFIPAPRLIMPVIKSDAYGHGLIPVAQALLAAGADRLGLATVEEGLTLRAAGIAHPLIILGAVLEDQIPDIVRYRLRPVLFRYEMARALSRAARAAGTIVPVHVKIDTGMGRLGLEPKEAVKCIERLRHLEGIQIKGIMTHLADTDAGGSATATDQLAQFQAVLSRLKGWGGRRPHCHAANSAALLDLPAARLDMVRTGLLLYGCYPSPKCSRPLDLRPVMTVKSRIVHLRRLPAGSGIGYSHTFITRRASVIATAPIGYAHGYGRALSNRGRVGIRGQRAPVVGSVCMDMTMVDVTGIKGVALGDEVVLLAGGSGPSAEELAEAAGTIPHEVLCALGARLPRVYTA